MPLVDYGSDEDATMESKTNENTPLTTKSDIINNTLPESESEDDVDHSDTFGFGKHQEKQHKEQEQQIQPEERRKNAPQISAAPDVISSEVINRNGSSESSALVLNKDEKEMMVNIPYDIMSLQPMGPQDPYDQSKISKSNTFTGYVEDQAMSDLDFRVQQRTFQVKGYARNPNAWDGDNGSGQQYVGDVAAAYANNGLNIDEDRPTKAAQRQMKRKRQKKGELGVFDDEAEEGAESREYKGPWAAWEKNQETATVPDDEDELVEYEAVSRASKKPVTERGNKEIGYGEEKSILHATSIYDYAGRSYLSAPRDTDVDLDRIPEKCYTPKKCIRTWSGHTKGVSAIRLFPESGHLILSGSMDSKIKLWDVYREGKVLRTFMGHSQAVKDVSFNNDGTRFLSTGYDRQIKLWDTETGQCIKAFSNGKMANVVRFNPDEDKQHIFLAGMHNKKIIQYDINSGDIVQEYDQHLGPVNTITFVDDNKRFVTTSDDKTVRAWDYDIPVVIKYIAEPSMHSLPAVTMHPHKKWLAMQSLDNEIQIYSAENFKKNSKKRFAGHTVSGYACEVAFSPNGQWISSGDGAGNVHFWDFQTMKKTQKLKAHNQVVISHAWLPHETSKLVTASWDGLIKLWD